MTTITLNTNPAVEMPLVGLGTWRAQPEEVKNAVQAALQCGYKQIDTAFNYNNEEHIGETLQEWFSSGQGKREDLFITTKLPHVGNRPSSVQKFLNLSLKNLKLDYVDLYLMHMPFSFRYDEKTYVPLKNEDGTFQLDVNSDLVGTWKMLEQQVKKGLARAIGLSNCNAEQVQRIYDAAEIKPSVLQIELHAYCQQKQVVDVCKRLNIAVTAYSPLGSPGANQHFSNKYQYTLDNFPDVLGHPVVERLAEKYQKTPAQILLRHHIQSGLIVIPKSASPKRIKENSQLFDFQLADEDFQAINELDQGEKGRIFDFLFFKGVEQHPEYPYKNRLS